MESVTLLGRGQQKDGKDENDKNEVPLLYSHPAFLIRPENAHESPDRKWKRGYQN